MVALVMTVATESANGSESRLNPCVMRAAQTRLKFAGQRDILTLAKVRLCTN
jgi:hypothetical protein